MAPDFEPLVNTRARGPGLAVAVAARRGAPLAAASMPLHSSTARLLPPCCLYAACLALVLVLAAWEARAGGEQRAG
jgi:hypothetical protein